MLGDKPSRLTVLRSQRLNENCLGVFDSCFRNLDNYLSPNLSSLSKESLVHGMKAHTRPVWWQLRANGSVFAQMTGANSK